MKEIEIKPLTIDEVNAVVNLDQICLGGLWKKEAYLREIESDKSTVIVLRLLSGENRDCGCKTSSSDLVNHRHHSVIIGMGCLWSIVDEAHITLLGVHPNYRGQGLGQLLLFSLLDDAIARKLEWATLEVNENNLAALNLYQKYGFVAVGRRKGYYQPAGEDALVLWLKNIQHNEFKTNLIQWQQKLTKRLSKSSYYISRTKIC